MSSTVSIIMYHYVRPLKQSRYPMIKGLAVEDFKEQIDYILKQYHIISAADMMDIVASGAAFPPNALLLTFDDGYSDHFAHVFPVLDEKKISGCFFPMGKYILEGRVPDVNKIHFILASIENKAEIVARINEAVNRHRAEYALETNDAYWQRLGTAGRFDTAEVRFIKRMLQRALPEPLRKQIVDALFRQFVTGDERAFAQELYLTLDQIGCMQRNGMYFGSHGFGHYWLNTVPPEAQEREIDLSLQFLHRIGSDTTRWIMCYPYGAYDEALVALLQRRHCTVGLTTQVGIADLERDHRLTLPRLDTNDLPPIS